MILFDKDKALVSRDIPTILGRIKSSKDEPAALLPKNHNQLVMEAKKIFSEEVRQRQASQQYGLHLTVHQRYVLRELKALYSRADDIDLRGQINILEKAFRFALSIASPKQCFLPMFSTEHIR